MKLIDMDRVKRKYFTYLSPTDVWHIMTKDVHECPISGRLYLEPTNLAKRAYRFLAFYCRRHTC